MLGRQRVSFLGVGGSAYAEQSPAAGSSPGLCCKHLAWAHAHYTCRPGEVARWSARALWSPCPGPSKGPAEMALGLSAAGKRPARVCCEQPWKDPPTQSWEAGRPRPEPPRPTLGDMLSGRIACQMQPPSWGLRSPMTQGPVQKRLLGYGDNHLSWLTDHSRSIRSAHQEPLPQTPLPCS